MRSFSGWDSAMASTLSRVINRGLSELLTALEIAFLVMEFLDKSPKSRLYSAELKVFNNSSWSAKEPESVDFKKVKFGKFGSLFLSASGKTRFSSAMGYLFKNSATLTSFLKDSLVPPMTLSDPCFFSGIFQLRSVAGFSIFSK